MLRLRGPRQPYLQIGFSVAGRARCEIVERPGLWLGAQDQDVLIDAMRAVAATAQLDPGSAGGALSGRKSVLDRITVTLVSDRTSGAPLGFAVVHHLELQSAAGSQQVMHLGPAQLAEGVPADMAWPLQGLAAALVWARGGGGAMWISRCAADAAALDDTYRLFADVFPGSDLQARRGFTQQMIAEALARQGREALGISADAPFDADRHFFGKPGARAAGEGQLALDYSQGLVLQIGRLDAAAALRLLRRQLPFGPRLRLGSRALWLVLKARLTPLLLWLRPDLSVGEIRPWRSN